MSCYANKPHKMIQTKLLLHLQILWLPFHICGTSQQLTYLYFKEMFSNSPKQLGRVVSIKQKGGELEHLFSIFNSGLSVHLWVCRATVWLADVFLISMAQMKKVNKALDISRINILLVFHVVAVESRKNTEYHQPIIHVAWCVMSYPNLAAAVAASSL